MGAGEDVTTGGRVRRMERSGRCVDALRPRLNPFRTERLDSLAYCSPETGRPLELAPLVDCFDALGRRAAVIGPEGSGKTTLLDALAPRLVARGLEVRRLRAAPGGGVLRGAEALDDPGPETVLFVDGLDRLPGAARRRVRRAARSAGGLLVTAHRPLRTLRVGRLGRLGTLTECATTPALLAALVARLSGASTPAAAPLPSAEDLHARHGGNLRTALLELYDLYAGR